MSLGLIPAILSQTRRILTKILRLDTDYTTARATKIDNLDATVASRLADADASARTQTGLTDQGYTTGRAPKLDKLDAIDSTVNTNLDATVSSRLADADAVARVRTGLTDQGYTTGRAPKIDNLDATVSSRLADADAVARVRTGLTDQGYTTGRAPHLDVLSGVVGSHNDNLFGSGSAGNIVRTTLQELDKILQFTDLTVNSGGILRPTSNSHILVLLVTGTLTVNSGGLIHADGFGAPGGVGASVVGTDGFMSKDGNLGFTPAIGATTLSGLNGDPGAGDPRQVFPLSVINDTLLFVKGAGGGAGPTSGGGNIGGNGGNVWAGGGKGGSNTGGPSGFPHVNGGVGGGSVIIFANNIVVNGGGRISARGLAPASNGVNAGAGGGGGGLVYLVFRSLTNSGVIDAASGAGGGSTGGNGSGGNGSDGIVVNRFVPS